MNKYNNEDLLDELFETFVKVGNLDKAKEYLEICRDTFSGYDRWAREFNVHQAFQNEGLGKVVMMKFEKEVQNE